MKTLIFKIKRRLTSTVRSFKSDCNFSVYYACLRVANELGGRLGFTRLSANARAKKDAWIYNYLKSKLSVVIDKYKTDTSVGEKAENAPIWVCWWTGEDTAPPLVKQCIKSIRKNAGNHPVHLITAKNHSEFLDIPDCIIDKVESGNMCIANFTDYLRVSLIGKYGGLWLDATIFCADTIPENYFNLPFFTCKSEERECGYISRMRWTSFVMGGWKENIFFRFMKNAFETYWTSESTAIDYLLVDHLIELANREIPAVAEYIKNVPINNTHRDNLQAAMNAAADAAEFENIVKKDTVLYKLSWRESYSTTTANGKDSVYKYFLETKN